MVAQRRGGPPHRFAVAVTRVLPGCIGADIAPQASTRLRVCGPIRGRLPRVRVVAAVPNAVCWAGHRIGMRWVMGAFRMYPGTPVRRYHARTCQTGAMP